MSTDPMFASSGTLSINRFTGNGAKTVWDLNFAGGYINQSTVKAYTLVGGVYTSVPLSWIGANQVSITPAVANGVSLVIYRDTPKDTPAVDFTDGAIINEINLDTLAKQSVFTAAEMVDRFSLVADQAAQASTLAGQAVALASATIGGDFTKFARTDILNTWTAAQNLPSASTLGGLAIATVSYVNTSVAGLATAASVTSAISTAATDASTKANAAQAAAAVDATNKDTAVKAAIQKQLDWLYTLATR